MNIRLTQEQENWIREHYVTEGSTVEDAVRQIVEERMARSDIEQDDLAWAIPFVESARSDIENGNILSLDVVQQQQAKLLKSLRR